MKIAFLFIPFLIAVSGEALIESRVDEKYPLSVSFSKTSHNRICIEGGAVERVIGDSSLFSVILDAGTGSAFINVLRDIPKSNPLTLTVVTSSGFIQDLLISSHEGLSEQVILKESEEWEGAVVRLETVQGGATIGILNAILEGRVPFGYQQRTDQGEDSFELPKPLKTKAIKIFEGPLDTLFVYKIKNKSKQTVVLSAEALKREDQDWVFLNVQELGPNQEAICITAQQKEKKGV